MKIETRLMKMRKKIVGSVGGLASLFLTFSVMAALPVKSNGARVAIVIGKEMISFQELMERLKLAALSLGLRGTQKELEKIKPAIISTLIDEALQIKAAESYNIAVNAETLDKSMQKVMNESKEKVEQFLKENNISKEAFQRPFKTDIVWEQYISQKYGDLIPVSQQEISQCQKMLDRKQRETQYRVAEIVLYVKKREEEKKVQAQALEIFSFLGNKVSFSAVAQQFSQASSRAQGGYVGWLAAHELDEGLQQSISSMRVGEYSPPMRTAAGFTILLLLDKRDALPKKEQKPVSREQALHVLHMERLKLLAHKELLDLRRKAAVEVRVY